MSSFIFGLICTGLALTFLALIKTYHKVPARELKRLAREADPIATLLYKPVAYGLSLRILLWLLTGLAIAASVVLFADILAGWLAVIFVAFIVWIGFVWIPSGDMSRGGLWAARLAAPVIAWILERLHPVLTYITDFIERHRPITIHTGLYEKEDVAELLERQRSQADSRIAPDEIELLIHALRFGDKLVSDVLVPKRVVTVVSAKEPVGPVLMGELHKSGHSRFPVYEGKRDNIVGILYLRDLVSTKKTGTVSSLMNTQLCYVHEDFLLYQTLQAFIKTKQHMFLVVNSFEEFVGIITIEDILEQVIGEVIVDEFDSYDNMRAVAALAAHKEHVDHQKSESEPVPSQTPDPDADPDS